ncbi:MAG: sulfate ABC transporter permease subunit CysT [Planctomycetaceae bacterium]|nr:sulfate ABC transporter permease subunit CysT [Planctomycetaceae bacterium]
MKWKFKQHSVLPGFGLTLGVTLTYLGLIVLLPLSLLVWNTSSLSWSDFLKAVSSAQVVASYKLTFGAAFLAAVVNAVFGFIAAWTLTRYKFPGKKLLDAIVDMPFAMPTSVSGIALTTIYASNGWVGSWFNQAGIKIAYTPIGVFIALTFIGLPFVVRTLQPSLEDLDKEIEEAAESLGATKWQTFWRVILPSVLPALATGFTLAFARALGEYGSVVFISGNLPMKTEITAFLIVTKLEQFDYAGATAISVVMLGASFVLMLIINMTQWYARRGKK